MATFVLIPGAGGSAWYWHLLVEELHRRGHEAVAVDLPAADHSAGLPEYADAVVEAIGNRTGLVVAAQSMAGFTAPMVCERADVKLLVLVNVMVPAPGESPGDWWANTGHAEARAAQAAREGRTLGGESELLDAFFHDVPAEVTAQAIARGEPAQSATRSGSRGRCRSGPTFPPGCCRVAMTGSSRPSSSAGSPRNDWASHPRRCPAGTSSALRGFEVNVTDGLVRIRSCNDRRIADNIGELEEWKVTILW